jgi:CO dehydrogenase maturation factor
MNVGFLGKGGSGKSTLTALCALQWARADRQSLVIDADVNQHLARPLGFDPSAVPALADWADELRTHLCGSNARLRASEMIKTTPPGHGSCFVHGVSDPLLRPHVVSRDRVHLLRAGDIEGSDIGVRCYHAKTGGVELLLNHLVLPPSEACFVDMTAGVDCFASGLFTRFDLTVLVVEPTLPSLDVYRQYLEQAATYDLPRVVVANKVVDDEDLAFVRRELGTDNFFVLPRLSQVRAVDRGEPLSKIELPGSALQTLDAILQAAPPRNAERFTRLAHLFHERNALSWGNAAKGVDLREQLDPNFTWPQAVYSAQSTSVA